MKHLLLFLATLVATRAMTVVGEIGIRPGFAEPTSMIISATGLVTLEEPGTYIAASWSISGELRLAKSGNYTIVGQSGSIAFNRDSKLRAPVNDPGTTRVTFVHAGDFINAGFIEPGILVNQGQPPQPEQPPLMNLSARTTLAAGETFSAGFIVGGRIPRRVLLRAIGPSLATFGIPNPLAAPTLTLFSGRDTLRTNSGWASEATGLAAVFSAVGAFPLAASNRDAAILITLNPGNYTVQVTGGTGEVLTEIYLVE